MTRDIDIVIRLRKRDIDGFAALFEGDFYLDKALVRTKVAREGIFNIIHNEYVVKVDFILERHVDNEGGAFVRRRRVEVDGVPAWIIGAEDLIIAKISWARKSGSEIQRRDVRNLLASVTDFDREYLERRLQERGLSGEYERVMSERRDQEYVRHLWGNASQTSL